MLEDDVEVSFTLNSMKPPIWELDWKLNTLWKHVWHTSSEPTKKETNYSTDITQSVDNGQDKWHQLSRHTTLAPPPWTPLNTMAQYIHHHRQVHPIENYQLYTSSLDNPREKKIIQTETTQQGNKSGESKHWGMFHGMKHDTHNTLWDVHNKYLSNVSTTSLEENKPTSSGDKSSPGDRSPPGLNLPGQGPTGFRTRDQSRGQLEFRCHMGPKWKTKRMVISLRFEVWGSSSRGRAGADMLCSSSQLSQCMQSGSLIS